MNAVLWFSVGLVVGLEVACLIAWWSLRRENRKRPGYVATSTFPSTPHRVREVMVFDHTKKRRPW